MTTTFYPSLNSLGVIPVSRLKNLEKNEGLGSSKIQRSARQAGRCISVVVWPVGIKGIGIKGTGH